MADISHTIYNRTLEPDAFADLCDEFLDLLRELTPVDTGFCQESWDSDVSDDEATFSNDCDYSSFLDEGWSDQAPSGMIGPAVAQLPDLVAKYR